MEVQANVYSTRQVNGEAPVINRSLVKLLNPAPSFQLIGIDAAERGNVKAFIADRFHQAHGATLREFLPHLLTVECRGHYCAALGIRPAGQGPLFLEHYLDSTAEQAVAAHTRGPVSRQSIVEVGNLVSGRNGASALIFLMLLSVVQKAGFHWVMFTGTPEVQRGICKLGFVIKSIGEARLDDIPGNHGDWGSYYEEGPQVVIGDVQASIASARQSRLMLTILTLFSAEIESMAASLFTH